jgi:hypothetical protein
MTLVNTRSADLAVAQVNKVAATSHCQESCSTLSLTPLRRPKESGPSHFDRDHGSAPKPSLRPDERRGQPLERGTQVVLRVLGQLVQDEAIGSREEQL